MFSLESVAQFPMTVDLAVRVSGMNRVPGERSLNSQRLFHLRREIDGGVITTFRWAIAYIRNNPGIFFRINGQHTSFIFASGAEPVGTVVLETYVCDSMEDLVSLWSRYDASFSSRTRGDILKTAFESDVDFNDLPKRAATLAASAAAVAKFGGSVNKVSHFEKSQEAVLKKDFIVWACKNLLNKPCMRVGVFLAAFYMHQESEQDAEVFWREVQSGENPNPLSGSRALQRLLLEYSVNRGAGSRTGKKTMTWLQMAELCLSAWSSWRKSKNVKSLKLSMSGLSRFVDFQNVDPEKIEVL